MLGMYYMTPMSSVFKQNGGKNNLFVGPCVICVYIILLLYKKCFSFSLVAIWIHEKRVVR